MPEYRQDPLSRRWVIIGHDRASRPNEFREASVRESTTLCPFCGGNESETPAAVATYNNGLPDHWLVRVVPNKYPAVTPDESLCPKCQPLSGKMVAETIPGFGCHEVVIESPRHVASLSGLSPAEAELVFTAYRDRIAAHKAAKDYRYVQIFKNVGPAAGASLEHGHSQLLALPGVPEAVQQELLSSHDHYRQHKRSLLADMIDRELAALERMVAQTETLVAFCPYASRFAYEVWVAPRQHRPRFEEVSAGELSELARLMQDVIRRIERAVGPIAYNYFLHTQPFDSPSHDHYHWHIEIAPRLNKVAGFEWGTGCFINPCPPEMTAEHLRTSQPTAVANTPGSSAWKE